MEETNINLSIDIEVEKKILNNLVDSIGTDNKENFDFISSFLNQNNETQNFVANVEPISLKIDSETILNPETNEISTPNVNLLSTETNNTNLPLIDPFSSTLNLSDQMNQIEVDIKNLQTNMQTTYENINQLSVFQRESDPFEERVTVLPTNLIFLDRIKRITDSNSVY